MPAANANQQSSSALSLVNLKPGIVNLRFEECKFTRKAAAILSEWLKTKVDSDHSDYAQRHLDAVVR